MSAETELSPSHQRSPEVQPSASLDAADSMLVQRRLRAHHIPVCHHYVSQHDHTHLYCAMTSMLNTVALDTVFLCARGLRLGVGGLSRQKHWETLAHPPVRFGCLGRGYKCTKK